jgi:hypothetical protein
MGDFRLSDTPECPDLDAIPLPEGEEPAAPEGTEADLSDQPAGEPMPVVIGKDEFFALFKMGQQLPGHLFSLKALTEHPEKPEARAASDAIYDIAAETPSLSWLIEPGGVWLPRLAAIGLYAVPLGMAVKAELKAKRQTAVTAKKATAEAKRESRLEAVDPQAEAMSQDLTYRGAVVTYPEGGQNG